MAIATAKRLKCCSKRSLKLKKANFAKAKKAADAGVAAHAGKKATPRKARGKKAANKPAKACKACRK